MIWCDWVVCLNVFCVCLFKAFCLLCLFVGALLVLCGGCSGQAAIEPHTNTERRAHTQLWWVCVCLLHVFGVFERFWCCAAVASVQNKRSRQTRGDNPPSTMYEKNALQNLVKSNPLQASPASNIFQPSPHQLRNPGQATGFTVYLQSSLK